MIGIPHIPARLPAGLPPLLLVVIDTEEEFDWAKPHDPDSRSVRSIAEQHRAQAILARYGVVPTYVVDHPVAATPDSAAVFRDWRAAGACVVGTHLHPWVNPPHAEVLSAVNSYPGNLPAELEREKLQLLTGIINETIGERPTIYKAGRYGLGPNTPAILADLGYKIDLSVVPATDFSADGGPDFRGYPHDPYWFGPGGTLFEVPLTRGYPGILGDLGECVHGALSGPLGQKLRLPGVLARLKVVERIQMTPEGVAAADNIRLADYLAGRGRRVFSYAYHSSTLLPGGSPYVADEAQRQAFLDGIDRFLDHFMGKLQGRAVTPYELRDMCRSLQGQGEAV